MFDGDRSDSPRCIGLFICNDVIEDKRTNNKTLVNVFNTITTNQLPVIQSKTVLVISITNATGHSELTVDLTDPEGGKVLSVNLHLASNSPLATHDLVLELLAVPFNYAGTYSFDVYAEGKPIGNRQFDVAYHPTEA